MNPETVAECNTNVSFQGGLWSTQNMNNTPCSSNSSSMGNQTKMSNAKVIAILVCVESTLGIVICFGNGLVIVSYMKFKTLRTIANFFIVNLAIADFGVGIMMPLHVAMYIFPGMMASSVYVCLLRYMVVMITVCASMLSLFGITVDRYIAIVMPLRYNTIMTRRNAYLLAGSIWGLPFVYTIIIPLFCHHTYEEFTNVHEDKRCSFVQVFQLAYLRVLCTGVFCLLLGTMIIMYARIFYDVHRSLGPRISINETNGSIVSKTTKYQHKLLRTTLIVLGCFIASWFPFLISLHAQIYFGMKTNEGWDSAREYSTFLGILNSAINPIIYAFRLKDFKIAFRAILCKGHAHQEAVYRTDLATIGITDNRRTTNPHVSFHQ